MKLRVRSQSTKETLKLEIPNSCSLHEFKQIISQQISSSSPSSIVLSLNQKEELLGAPEDSLLSFGVTSGDLIFYSLNFSNPQHTLVSIAPNFDTPKTLDQELQQVSQSDVGMIEFGETLDHSVQYVSQSDEGMAEFSENLTQNQETLDLASQSQEMMDVDEGYGSAVANKFSVPGFLRKVLRGELSDEGKKHHKILMIAVHAVLLDSGFLPFDSLSNAKIDHFQPSNTCASGLLSYTLPELTDSGSEIIESVSLKFENLGNYIIVYGSLTRNGSEVRKLRLDENNYAPAIDIVWTAQCDSFNPTVYNSKSLVFEFWKIVKDKLALPLLIDLCDRTGLILPPCFMRLPTELKLKILELLPGVDLARAGCVSTELGYLSSNDELWKMKFEEEYGNKVMNYGRGAERMWKTNFASFWGQGKKDKVRPSYTARGYPHIGRPFNFPIRIDPQPFGPGRIIGGEHDLWPGGLVPFPVTRGRTRSMPRHGGHRIFSPDCHLGRLSP